MTDHQPINRLGLKVVDDSLDAALDDAFSDDFADKVSAQLKDAKSRPLTAVERVQRELNGANADLSIHDSKIAGLKQSLQTEEQSREETINLRRGCIAFLAEMDK